MPQEDQLYAFGRPTYGRLGRDDVGASSDDAVPDAKPVSNLDGIKIAGMAAGKVLRFVQTNTYAPCSCISQMCIWNC